MRQLASSGLQLLEVWEIVSYNKYINVQAVMHYPSPAGNQLQLLSGLLSHLTLQRGHLNSAAVFLWR
jgi:hypothetical protein